MRVNKTIIRPIVTEKSLRKGETDVYLFKVSKSATKNTVAKDIERLFGVDVLNVRTMIMPGKRKRVRNTRRFTKTPTWKKAEVQIKSGQKISLVEESN